MLTICDTHILIFWQDDPDQLSKKAAEALETGLWNQTLGCSDISLWEIAMLFKYGRLRQDVSARQYMNDLILVMSLVVLPITADIAVLSQQEFFFHKDPADRIIAATAMQHKSSLISADKELQKVKNLNTIW